VLDHSAVFHRGPAGLAPLVAADLIAAVGRGEAVLASLAPEAWYPLREQLGDAAAGVRWLRADERYATPAGAMTTLHRFVVDALAAGAPAVWSLGALAFEGSQADEGWVRYEHAVNDVLGDVPLHALCAYDLDATSDDIVAHALASHAGVHGEADGRVEPASGIPGLRPVGTPDRAPLVDADVAQPSSARASVTCALNGVVTASVLTHLRLVTSELVANAIRHGGPPAHLRLWCGDDVVVVQVTDAGRGITDPYADLRPTRNGDQGGRGLNIVAQLAQLHFDVGSATAVVTAAVARR
jgi:anti-sigma regulatory factor (Ser/Thr protein kinase)